MGIWKQLQRWSKRRRANRANSRCIYCGKYGGQLKWGGIMHVSSKGVTSVCVGQYINPQGSEKLSAVAIHFLADIAEGNVKLDTAEQIEKHRKKLVRKYGKSNE